LRYADSFLSSEVSETFAPDIRCKKCQSSRRSAV